MLADSSSDRAFTEAMKQVQKQHGSRLAVQRSEEQGAWPTVVTPDLAAFIAERDSFYLATASRDGRPYMQHRGGPKGFLAVLDAHTLGFADFRGNRQYATLGNLSENDQALIFLMDYARGQRAKIWGRARAVTDDAALLTRLMPVGYKARPEQAVLFEVAVWNVNCPRHIPRKFDAGDVTATIAALQQRVAVLEAENTRLRGAGKS